MHSLRQSTLSKTAMDSPAARSYTQCCMRVDSRAVYRYRYPRVFLAMSMATSRLSATTETEGQTQSSDASPKRRLLPSITEGAWRPTSNESAKAGHIASQLDAIRLYGSSQIC